ncbi:MAG: hypothetical protein HOV87_20675 [Catenulispora sp.]|nr:hypothetical protein [Catenulispora sp.]
METADIIKTASVLLGTELSEPVDLGGSNRSTVLRVRTAERGTVILKAHGDEREYLAERGGLRFTDLGPRLLAAEDGLRLIVMEDLGGHRNLADVLLGGDEAAARAALVEWAAVYGRLAAASVGREHELPARTDEPWLREYGAKFAALLDGLGIEAPDIDEVVTALEQDRFRVFSPGDICPDNNLLTPGGLRPIDFEDAGFHSVFLDAAYTRMPFATCWCVFRLPKMFSLEAERAYRGEVVTAYPELADDRVWRPGIRLATVAHVALMSALLFERVREEDQPMHRSRPEVPSIRTILRYRWDTTAAALERAGELPAFAAAFRALLAATEHWHTADLPVYPALRD